MPQLIRKILFVFSELQLETESIKKDDVSSVAESPKPPLVKCRECRQLLDDVKMFTGDPSFAVRLFPIGSFDNFMKLCRHLPPSRCLVAWDVGTTLLGRC